MTMGPDPSSRIFWMSVRRGISAAFQRAMGAAQRQMAAGHGSSSPFGLTGRD
jgi:hypothetical protein